MIPGSNVGGGGKGMPSGDTVELRRAEALLRAVGPAPDVSSSLGRAVSAMTLARPARHRRKMAAGLALAACLATITFVIGLRLGGDDINVQQTVTLEATPAAPRSWGLLRIGERDAESGNLQLSLDVSGLPTLPSDEYYLLWLEGDGVDPASCAVFNAGPGTTQVTANVTYRPEDYDTWVITRHPRQEGGQESGGLPPPLLTAPV